MRPFRLVVAGGRDFGDANYLAEVLERSLADYAPAEVSSQLSESSPYGPLQIVSGGARGADSLGEQWAQQRGVPVQRYPARWDDLSAEGAVVRTNRTGQPYNANAGFARNEEMARNADAVLALPGGRGTDHMVRTALAMGLPVWDARSGDLDGIALLPGAARAMAGVARQPASPPPPVTEQLSLLDQAGRFAGQAWPYLAAAGGGAALIAAAASLQPDEPPPAPYPLR